MNEMRHSRRATGRGFASRLVVVLALTALLGVSLSSSAGAGSSADLKKVTLRLDFLIRGHHSGFYVALAKGWYKDAGLDVSIAEGTGSAATAQSVAAGNDTFGFVDATTIFTGKVEGSGA